MNRTPLEIVSDVAFLNDDNLAARVIQDNDVQWCLNELYDLLQLEAEGRLLRLPPVNRGDKVWTIRRYHSGRAVAHTKITTMELDGGKIYITTFGGGRGFFGEQIFLTKEEALKALEREESK